MFHFGSPVNDWPRAVAQLLEGYVTKVIDNVQMLAESKAVNPGVKTILRHWYQQQVPGDSFQDNKQRARDFFDSFIDDTFINGSTHGINHAAATDYVEEWNEYFGNSQTPEERERFILWAQAVAEVWTTEYRTIPGLEHIRLILANTAIGNDIPVEVARTAAHWDCLLGYHPYWPVQNDYTPEAEWEWYSGRWTELDYKYRSQGIVVDWAFTEAGAVRYWGDWPNIGLDAGGGWKHPECHDSNLGEYKESIARWMNKWSDWNATHDNRALPPVLFDSRPDGWEHFQIHQPVMDEIAQFVQQWQPGNPSQPPPPPPPVDDRGKPREQYARVYNVIYPDATEERAAEIFMQGWRLAKQTSGGSYDDAGVGDLDNRKAILWDVPADRHTVMRDWFAHWYPGVHVEFANEGNPSPFLGSPVDGIPLQVTSPFGVPRDYSDPPDGIKESLHGGIDLVAIDEHGQPVPIVAVEEGAILWASDQRRSGGPSKLGNHVIQQLNNGLIVWYGHLSTLSVQSGHDVSQGDFLGLAGTTGNSTAIHLHFTTQDPVNGINDSRYKFRDVVDPSTLLGL